MCNVSDFHFYTWEYRLHKIYLPILLFFNTNRNVQLKAFEILVYYFVMPIYIIQQNTVNSN